MREQDFQQALRIELAHALPELRLWRQPAGRIPIARGGFVDAAPVGAADLSGIVRGEGWRFELEVKGPRTPETEAQRHWQAFIVESGGVGMQIRYDARLDLEANIVRGAALVREAIAARRARSTVGGSGGAGG